MQQKVINFHQFILNNIIFYKISKFSIKPAISKEGIYYDYLPIFYDINSSSIEPVYYIPIEYCKTFGDIIKNDITSDNLVVAGSSSSDKWSVLHYCVIIKRDNLFELVSTDSNIEYFPCHKRILDMLVSISEDEIISFVNNLTNSFRKRQLNQFYESNDQINLIFSYFDSIDRRIQYSQTYDLGLIKIKAEIKNNKLKLSSNKDLVLQANGVCKEILFHEELIILNKYYHFPNNFNLVKHGIIYCDIIQEQIVGEAYRQVLKIITLDSNENSQILSNNLDLQYVPVKKNFINSINISIQSLTGDYVKFADDFIYTIVKLHFRKIL